MSSCRIVAGLLLVVFLVGCGGQPPKPVANPDALEKEAKQGREIRGKLEGGAK
ncbi:MAG: hypothetical protein K1X57_04670 [Gemmataceae bacterium]|nr:hypothetical protein [Gemmataceae bacterium]